MLKFLFFIIVFSIVLFTIVSGFKSKKKLLIFLSSVYIILSIICSHIPLSFILRTNLDEIDNAYCVWYGEDSFEKFKENYKDKTYRIYTGPYGCTAFADITLFTDGEEVATITDLGSLGVITCNGVSYQQRGCYADQELEHIKNTLSSGWFLLPSIIIAFLLSFSNKKKYK